MTTLGEPAHHTIAKALRRAAKHVQTFAEREREDESPDLDVCAKIEAAFEDIAPTVLDVCAKIEAAIKLMPEDRQESVPVSRAFNRIIKAFGTQENLAKALGCRQGTIAGWKRRGYIPVRQQARVFELARSMNIDLKPDDFFVLETDNEATASAPAPAPAPAPAQ